MTRDEECAIEWDCQKVLRQFYHFADQREYEKATNLLVSDVEWDVLGVKLRGRDNILKGLLGGVAKRTIAHVLTNTVVDVIDETHAVSKSYNSDYCVPGVRVEDGEGARPFVGPHRLEENYTELIRVDDDWLISKRKVTLIFSHNPSEPAALETGARAEGKEVSAN